MGYATAVEDYVKAIYAHTEWQPQPVTTSVLAMRLGLAASSVTEMVKKLVAHGLVEHVPYGAIVLTTDGTALALRMVRRHRLIETWLVRQFGYGWDEVHEEAEVLEHALSDRLLDAIEEQLGSPLSDPHGDPIPSRDGVVVRPDAFVLGDATHATPGQLIRLVRISDRDPELLRSLEGQGTGIGSELRVTSVDPLGVKSVDGRTIALPANAAESIWATAQGRARVK
jgi:DtxR family Mn-dependent transcriptional regulator